MVAYTYVLSAFFAEDILCTQQSLDMICYATNTCHTCLLTLYIPQRYIGRKRSHIPERHMKMAYNDGVFSFALIHTLALSAYADVDAALTIGWLAYMPYATRQATPQRRGVATISTHRRFTTPPICLTPLHLLLYRLHGCSRYMDVTSPYASLQPAHCFFFFMARCCWRQRY